MRVKIIEIIKIKEKLGKYSYYHYLWDIALTMRTNEYER